MGTLAKNTASFLVVSIIFLVVLIAHGNANENSWQDSAPTLTEQKTYTIPQDASILDTIGSNTVPCVKTWFKIESSKKIQVCAYSFSGGRYGNGYILLNGTSTAGKLASQMGNYTRLIPLPGQSRLAELVSASGGYKLYFYDNPFNNIAMTKGVNGTITYTLPATAVPTKNSAGSLLYVDSNTVSVSANGRWLIADGLGNSGFVRVNTLSGEVFSFAPTLNNPFSLNAISDDGRYTAISTQTPEKKFLLFDTANCTKNLGSAINTCPYVNLQQAIIALRPSYYATVSSPEFINSNLLQFYGTYDRVSASNRKIGLFTLSPDEQSLTKVNYLALGDSFSSGEGAYNYRPETNIADNRCHQSYSSYGYLLHSLLSTSGTYGSIACSGAKIKDVVSSSEKEYSENQAQAKNKSSPAYDNDISLGFLPGYRTQYSFVNLNKPNIITLSMGGNDIGFADIITKCVIGVGLSDCYPYYEDRKELVGTINSQYEKLRDMYTKLKQSAAPDARIYVIGYPEVAYADGNCANNVHFDHDEIVFSNQLVSFLNYVIKNAAQDAGAYYVDTTTAFAGHRLCETDSSKVAVNGLTVGNGGPINGVGPLAKESYHPNKLGHELFAQTINSQTHGLTASMPAPNPTATLAVPDDANIPLLATAPHSNRTIKTIQYMQDLSTDLLLKNSLLALGPVAQFVSLKPSSQFNLSLHSDPIALGTMSTDTSGNLSGEITIPPSLPTGYHTLYFEGKNILGEDITLTKIVYVAESAADYDGDGIANINEACTVIEPSNTDYDKDGIDDACDDLIDEPPAVPAPVIPPSPSDTQNPQDQTNPPGENPTDPPVIVEPSPEVPPVIVDPPVTPTESVPGYKLNDTLPPVLNTEVITPAASTVASSPAVAASPPASTATTTFSDQNQNSASKSPEISQPTTTVAGISDKNEQPQLIASSVAVRHTSWLLVFGAPLLLLGLVVLFWRIVVRYHP